MCVCGYVVCVFVCVCGVLRGVLQGVYVCLFVLRGVRACACVVCVCACVVCVCAIPYYNSFVVHTHLEVDSDIKMPIYPQYKVYKIIHNQLSTYIIL